MSIGPCIIIGRSGNNRALVRSMGAFLEVGLCDILPMRGIFGVLGREGASQSNLPRKNDRFFIALIRKRNRIYRKCGMGF